ncbi:MAG: adenosylcobinamide kinase/adenosylcobinamide phosphate guanyltransferase [Actinophytocola sp.]|uniref:bifunctional adenosylcobinamide kinase/adenosylcobinamide-phosphate guanylyltransferase n=1 Tax=Actinophytocola sp. TaxID=1872138 RepID=UPI00132A481E|nr:bifunctional adenosylcobinamide kinase/adenosylcobinamide-phosphate guanylyltransferase [Actinophytocola sp.]MPZ83346.1 adenosylcobinamide kinase/adenosylcobinamide phosphate guanyltransferase [Actinophytocola sp.]
MATLVLGGARSGKSAHAEGLLAATAAIYVATARRDPADPEWTARIAAHVERRPPAWRTVEVADPAQLGPFLEQATGPVVVDDIATWLTALLDDANAWEGGALDPVRDACDRLAESVGACQGELVLVSSEVGLGVVPATRSGRLFRDQLGALNAALADRCTDVVLLVAGIPLRLR